MTKKTVSVWQIFFYISTAGAIFAPSELTHPPGTAALDLEQNIASPRFEPQPVYAVPVASTESLHLTLRSPAAAKQEIKVTQRARKQRLRASLPSHGSNERFVRNDDLGGQNSIRRESLAAFAEAASNAAEEIYRETSQRYLESRKQIMRESAKTIGVIDED